VKHAGLAALAMAVALGAGASSRAEPAYPTREIRLVVPQAPGGTTDLLARMVGEQMERRLGVPVIVDNKPGANGVIGNEAVKRAAPDGYTLLAASTSTHVMTAHVLPGLAYDPLRDFVPVANLVYQTKVVLVNASLGVSTMSEFVALVRSRPGRFNYASTGPGSSSHLDTELLAARTGLDLVQIPYRGSGQTVQAVSTNEVQVLLASVTSAQAALASNRVRALAVLADRRSPLLPDVPTLAEAGLQRVDVQTWIGLLAPAGTPASVVDTLNRALNAILQSPPVQAWLARQGLEAIGGSAPAFDAEMRADHAKWGKLVKDLGLGR
jgi:tripartite-type tricarboxylate transporter receptor subunit TctC